MVNVNLYFIHARWLKDRERVINEFKKHIMKFKFTSIKINNINIINDFDPEDIQSDTVQQNVNYNQIADKNLAIYNQCIKNLHVNQLSNVLKHRKALELISKVENDDDINIVLEDDIIYEERVFISLEKLIRKLPVDFDVIFLGLPTNKEVKVKTDISLQNTKEVFRIIPYCDSYIISKNVAKRMLEKYTQIKFINNIQMSYVMDLLELKSQLVVPNIFMDGSKYGTCVSVLMPSSTLMFNNELNYIKNIITKDSITQEEKNNVESLFRTSQIKEHPDFGHIKAMFIAKFGDIKNAMSIFEETYQKYKKANCIINNENAFLKDYIKIHRLLQTDLIS